MSPSTTRFVALAELGERLPRPAVGPAGVERTHDRSVDPLNHRAVIRSGPDGPAGWASNGLPANLTGDILAR